MSAGEYRVLPIDQVRPSPTNPRTHFDSTKLNELAASILEKGVIEPAVVRPVNGHFELVVGERRYRASKMAGKTEFPVIVRELSDLEVLELQVIENIERDDLHPLEEAEGYRRLQLPPGRYDVQKIADKIGRSGKYVYDRLKLLELIPELKELFLKGTINSAHAVILSRLQPADQRRALEGEERWGQVTGLFQVEQVDPTQLDIDTLSDEEIDSPRKPVSSRELQTWVNRHVRFRPEVEDLENLFPETAAVIADARDQEVKIVYITHDYRVADDARDPNGVRTYGVQSWRRADGKPDPEHNEKLSDECDRSVVGVVVAGDGRGEAFRVCVDRKRCKVHFAKEIREAAKKAKARESGEDPAKKRKAERDSWEVRAEKERAERNRWEKAGPKLLEALAAVVETADIEKLLEVLEDHVNNEGAGVKALTKYFAPGGPQDIARRIRFLAFLLLSDNVTSTYWAAQNAPKALKPWGIDAKAIVDQVAPKEKPKPKAKPAAKKKAAKKKAAKPAKAAS